MWAHGMGWVVASALALGGEGSVGPPAKVREWEGPDAAVLCCAGELAQGGGQLRTAYALFELAERVRPRSLATERAAERYRQVCREVLALPEEVSLKDRTVVDVHGGVVFWNAVAWGCRELQSELRKKYEALPLERPELELGWLALASVEDGDFAAELFRSVVEAAENRNARARWITPEAEKLLVRAQAYRTKQSDKAFVAALLVQRRYPGSASAAKAATVLRDVIRQRRSARECQPSWGWMIVPPDDLFDIMERFTPGLVRLEFGAAFPRNVEEFRVMLWESSSPNPFGDGIVFSTELLPTAHCEALPDWLRAPRSLDDLPKAKSPPLQF